MNKREIQQTKKVIVPKGEFCCSKITTTSGRVIRRQCPLQDFDACSLYKNTLEWDTEEKAFVRLAECKAGDINE